MRLQQIIKLIESHGCTARELPGGSLEVAEKVTREIYTWPYDNKGPLLVSHWVAHTIEPTEGAARHYLGF